MNDSDAIDKNVRLVGKKSNGLWWTFLIAAIVAGLLVWAYQQGYFDQMINTAIDDIQVDNK